MNIRIIELNYCLEHLEKWSLNGFIEILIWTWIIQILQEFSRISKGFARAILWLVELFLTSSVFSCNRPMLVLVATTQNVQYQLG